MYLINSFPHKYLRTFLSQVSRMHVVLFRLVLRKKAETMMILSGSKSPVPRAVELNDLARVLFQIVVASTPIRKTIQQAG